MFLAVARALEPPCTHARAPQVTLESVGELPDATHPSAGADAGPVGSQYGAPRRGDVCGTTGPPPEAGDPAVEAGDPAVGPRAGAAAAAVAGDPAPSGGGEIGPLPDDAGCAVSAVAALPDPRGPSCVGEAAAGGDAPRVAGNPPPDLDARDYWGVPVDKVAQALMHPATGVPGSEPRVREVLACVRSRVRAFVRAFVRARVHACWWWGHWGLRRRLRGDR